MHIKSSLALILASVPAIFAGQIALSPTDVIGFNGVYDSRFEARNILDHQTGLINEPLQDGSYWLNPDNGPVNAYILIDLGAAYHVTSFDLFNTHNSFYGDRGTGKFAVEAGNTIGAGAGPGSDLSGPFVTLVGGTLLAADPNGDPLVAQSFASSDPGFYRYIRFSPLSVATFNASCCGANNYGLNELRAFGASTSDAPEPAHLSLFGVGLIALRLLRKRTA